MVDARNSRIGVRIPSKDRALLNRICRNRGEDLSDFIRRSIRTEMAKLSFLTPLDKKALGIVERPRRDRAANENDSRRPEK
jgi:hypothetical protein